MRCTLCDDILVTTGSFAVWISAILCISTYRLIGENDLLVQGVYSCSHETELLQNMSTFINNKYVRIVWSLWNLIGVSAEYCRGACQISKRSDHYTISLTVSKVGENRCWKVERAIHRWPVDSLQKGSGMLKTCTCHEIMCHLWSHGDVIKWKQFPRYWTFVRGIHRSPRPSWHHCNVKYCWGSRQSS